MRPDIPKTEYCNCLNPFLFNIEIGGEGGFSTRCLRTASTQPHQTRLAHSCLLQTFVRHLSEMCLFSSSSLFFSSSLVSFHFFCLTTEEEKEEDVDTHLHYSLFHLFALPHTRVRSYSSVSSILKRLLSVACAYF
jgi:hypothetical protein